MKKTALARIVCIVLLLASIHLLYLFNLNAGHNELPSLTWLEEWIAQAVVTEANNSSPANDNSPAVFAFMTEPRCLAAVPFVLKNALDKLPPSFPVVFFHSSHNAKCLERWLNETPALWQAHETGRLIVELESHMDPNAKKIYEGSNWNNVLFTNITFWEGLRQYGNTALTIQADTLICADGNSSNPYNYTPPWDANYLGGISWVKDVLPSNASNTNHLNGGLSIRNLDWVISCLQQSKNFSDPEDNLFGNCKGGVNNVSVVDAMSFSSDNGYTMCFDWDGHRQCPWGVHKPWERPSRRRPAQYRELVSYCPDIEKLQVLLRTNG
uniref:DUF5672 domain-containing protein n=1 Tax=Amphora coffeiformis TaxID=265554 RepID=A0A7S3KZM5_9STRA|eukprot:scaffold4510_cov183-Amphora_coffeaeformis.AAC.25